MAFISDIICSYADYPAAKKTLYPLFYSSAVRSNSILQRVQNYFLDFGMTWNGIIKEGQLQEHVEKSRQRILKGQVQLLQKLPKERAITVAIFGLGATEPCEEIAASARVSKIYAYNYDRRSMESCLAGLPVALRAKFELVQLDLTGGLFNCLELIFSVHKDPKVVRHAYNSLYEYAEQISFFPPLPKVDYVICSFLLTQLPADIEEIATEFYQIKFSQSLQPEKRANFYSWITRRFLEVLFETVVPGGMVFLSDAWEVKPYHETQYRFRFPIREALGRFTIREEAKWHYGHSLPESDGSVQSMNAVAFLLERPS